MPLINSADPELRRLAVKASLLCRNVTFPARSYAINGERRTYALLRPIVDSTGQTKLRQMILDAFQEFEERAAIAS